MIISFKDISKYYGTKHILDKISGTISSGSRIGIIGANGAGKTTLINIISGTLPFDNGELYINPSVKFGYLTQKSIPESDRTVYEEAKTVFAKEEAALLAINNFDFSSDKSKYEYDKLIAFIQSRDAYNIDIHIKTVLNGMGFTETWFNKKVNVLSGGEKTRLAIAKLLLTDANVLLLDEPTNHLDFATCDWLEKYLSEYKGTVISVTHDRYYLDKVCDTLWEIELSKLTVYKENYSGYKLLKAKKHEEDKKSYNKLYEKQEKLKDYVARNKVRASTSAMAKSRQKELEKMGDIEKPREFRENIRIRFNFDKQSWFDVLSCENVDAYAGGHMLFTNFNLDVKAGEKIAFIGDNGVGKTTLFKILNGASDEYNGRIKWGKEILLGIFEQIHNYDDEEKSILNEYWDHFPTLTENEVRSALAGLMFYGDDIYKKLSSLSGGESARLQLAILSNSRNNTLMFDEPTNHLDMYGKEILEKALIDFKGTEFIISHDRYLLNSVPDKIVHLSPDKITVFDGKFDDFKKSFQTKEIKADKKKTNTPVSVYQKSKESRTLAAKKRAEISNAEKEITRLETQISEIEIQIQNCSTDFEKLTKLCNTLENSKKELEKVTDIWLELSE